MRCVNDDCDVVLGDRPFQNGEGASLYVGRNGRQSINYRRFMTMDEDDWNIISQEMIDPGAASIPKCQAVAQVDSPTAELQFTVPADWYGQDLWFQVRTFLDDYENETIYKPRKLTIDDDGEDGSRILGTVKVVSLKKLDGGGVRIAWTWTRVGDGVQPQVFVVSKVTGSGTISPVSVAVSASRNYEADVIGLTNGVAYTFKISGERVSPVVETDLATGIAFTGDAAGPPAVSGLAAVPV